MGERMGKEMWRLQDQVCERQERGPEAEENE